MEINTSKTKEMVLGRLANTNLLLPNIALLGVHIDSTLSWSTHIEHIIKKATTRNHKMEREEKGIAFPPIVKVSRINTG